MPFLINNDGTLLRNAAEIFFANLLDAEKAGTLEPDIYVLELGIGVGLFARFFLDHFQEICAKHKKDYYDRLCYVAADRSQRMLWDMLRHGVLSKHPGRYRVRQVDAMEPDVLPYCTWILVLVMIGTPLTVAIKLLGAPAVTPVNTTV